MPILGVIASSISGNLWPANSYESIATFTASGGETSYTFSSIPQTYKHLQIRGFAIDTFSSYQTVGHINLRINGDTSSSSYTLHYMAGDGSTVYVSGFSSTNYPYMRIYGGIASSNVANIGAVSITDLHDYTSSTKNKTVRAIAGTNANNAGTATLSGLIYQSSGLWLNTAAITSLTLIPDLTSFAAGTKIALYGIKGA